MPRYRVTQPAFVAPEFISQAAIDKFGGVLIDFDGVPSVTWEPMDADAEARMTELLKTKPNLDPISALRNNGGEPGEIAPTASFVAQTPVDAQPPPVLSLGMPSKAGLGLTEGGKALELK